jgi:hypothetical protein
MAVRDVYFETCFLKQQKSLRKCETFYFRKTVLLFMNCDTWPGLATKVGVLRASHKISNSERRIC